MAAKKLKKKQIKEDQLVTFALRFSNVMQEHFSKIVIGVVVLAAAVAVVLFTAQARRNTAREAEREFARAMNTYQAIDKSAATPLFGSIADRYSGHEVGKLALYFQAECQSAELLYPEAIASYERYLSKAGPDAEFRIAAMIGKALANEGLGNYLVAAEQMEEVAGSLDKKDPRYVESLYRAATFYSAADDRLKAVELYKRVVDEGSGPLSDQAGVWVALLE